MGTDPKQVVRRAFEEVWAGGRPDRLDELFSEDYRAHLPMAGEIGRGRLAEGLGAIREAFPDLRVELLSLSVTHGQAVYRWRAVGTHEGELLGFAGSGRRVYLEGTTISLVRGERVAREVVHFDAMALVEQLDRKAGLGSGPPEGPRGDLQGRW